MYFSYAEKADDIPYPELESLNAIPRKTQL